MPAEGADDGEVIVGSELDLVDRPALELGQLGDHPVDRVDPDRVITARAGIEAESPEFPDRGPAQLAPEVVGGFVEGAEGEAVVAETGPEEFPELGRILQPVAGDEGPAILEVAPHRLDRHIVAVGTRPFPVSADAILPQFDEQVVLHSGGAERDREGMAHGQVQVAEDEIHRAIGFGIASALADARWRSRFRGSARRHREGRRRVRRCTCLLASRRRNGSGE